MKFNDITEKTLIEEIKKEFSSLKPGLSLGIGDDAAVIKAGKKQLLLTKDLLLDGIHFYKDAHPPFLLGRKSLNVSLSDIAAMGGTPLYALLGLGLPENTSGEWIEGFFSGIKSAAEEFDTALAGGDISRSEGMTLSVTVIGEGKNIIKRSGARPGDVICISGKLGDSAQGLRLLNQGAGLGDDQRNDVLLKAFFDPVPQVVLGKIISEKKIASSMIDVSDGLSVDLNHLCEESGVGAEIVEEKIPVSDEVRFYQKKDKDICLHGGEDYSLLFTVLEEKKSRLKLIAKEFDISEIGRMTGGKDIILIKENGQREKLEIRGYQHFFR